MKILHLYYDLMNLYGEYANISALCRIFEVNNIEYTLDKMSLGEELTLSDYDFIYVGSGSEENQKLALAHLKEYKQDLDAYIQNGKIALFTGNSFEMLGKGIKGFLGEFEALEIFDFETNEQNKTRTTADAIFEMSDLDNPLVGFINKCSTIVGITEPLFTVKMGIGNNKEDKGEGIKHNNFFGTHLTGPVLVKNPHFLRFVAEIACKKELDDSIFLYEKAGYETTLKKLSERV